MGRHLTTIRLPYIAADVDRHGNARYYVRRKGFKKVRLPGKPGSADFMRAYHAALAGKPVAQQQRPAGRDMSAGTFNAVLLRFYASPYYRRLDGSTKKWQRRALDWVSDKHGAKKIADMQPRHIRKLRDEKADTPGAANHLIKALRALFNWAFEEDLVGANPTLGVKRVAYAKNPHHTWTQAEVAQYEAKHGPESKARLAMLLLLFTAGRREDAVRLGRDNIVATLKGERMVFNQAKNEHRKPIRVDIPLHPELAAAIEGAEHGRPFLRSDWGKDFSPAGFGNRFRDWCDEASLPHCSAHGLRKAAAARLVEAGCSVHEVMAITGHQSVEEVERYTREYSRPMVADRAMKRLISAAESANASVPLLKTEEKSGTLEVEKTNDYNAVGKDLALPRGLEPLFSP